MKRERWNGFAGYDGWFARANNATFGVLAAYNELVPAFERLFERSGPRFRTLLCRGEAPGRLAQGRTPRRPGFHEETGTMPDIRIHRFRPRPGRRARSPGPGPRRWRRSSTWNAPCSKARPATPYEFTRSRRERPPDRRRPTTSTSTPSSASCSAPSARPSEAEIDPGTRCAAGQGAKASAKARRSKMSTAGLGSVRRPISVLDRRAKPSPKLQGQAGERATPLVARHRPGRLGGARISGRAISPACPPTPRPKQSLDQPAPAYQFLAQLRPGSQKRSACQPAARCGVDVIMHVVDEELLAQARAQFAREWCS